MLKRAFVLGGTTALSLVALLVLLWLASSLNPLIRADPTSITAPSATYAVELAPPTAAQDGLPGQPVTHALTLTNTGSVTESFYLTPTITGPSWATTVTPTHTAMLPPDGATSITVAVLISPTAMAGAQSAALIVATSVNSPTVNASSTLTTTAVVTGVPYRLTLVAAPTILPVDDSSTLTATVYDFLDTALSGQVVTFTSGDSLGGGSSLPLTDTTDAQGRATVVISSTLSGVKRITATAYNGVAASTEITFYDDLGAIAKSADPTHGLPDAPLTFTIAYTNNSPITLINTIITDLLPANTTYLTDTSGLPVASSTGRLTWTVNSLSPGSTHSFTLRLRYDETACRVMLTNTVAINPALPDTITGNNRAQATYRVDCDVDLVVSKNDGTGLLSSLNAPLRANEQVAQEHTPLAATQASVTEGGLITYTINVTNVGSYTATHVVLTETLPEHTDYVGGGWTHVSGRTFAQAVTVGDVHSFVVRVHDLVPDGVDNLVNLVCGGSDDPDVNPGDNCSYVATPVQRRPLRVIKSAPACVSPGDWFVYDVTYRNITTDTTFYDVGLTDTLPISVSYAGGSGWNCAGRVCSQTISSIPPGTRESPLLSVQLDAAFPYVLQTSITNAVEMHGGNRFELATSIDVGPDLLVTKNDNVGALSLAHRLEWDQVTERLWGANQTTRRVGLHQSTPFQTTLHRMSVHPGEPITYTILYLNGGIGPATGVILTETLPEYTGYLGGGWTHAGGRQYTMTVGDLAPGQGGQVQFIVQLNDAFPISVDRVTNRVDIGGEQPECDLSNNASTRETPVQTDLKLYVANRDSGTVEVFNTTNFEHITTIPVGGKPFGMADYGDLLFVANSDLLQVIDTTNDTVVALISEGQHPIHVAAYEGYVYTANHGEGAGITVLEASEPYSVVAHLRLDRELTYDFGFFGITVDEKRGLIYSAKRDYGSVGLWSLTPPGSALSLSYVFPTDEEGREKPSSIVYNPDTDLVYVTFGLIDELWVLDPESWELLERIPTGHQDPTEPGFGGHGLATLDECVFVSNYLDQSVTAVVNESCMDSQPAPPPPPPPYPYRVYLPLVAQNYAAIKTIPLSGRPKGMAGVDNLLFVTLPFEDRVAVIDVGTLTVIANISVPGDHPHTVILAGGNYISPAP
jgi:uncharacterized repeat protein (TIGR01451 family)